MRTQFCLLFELALLESECSGHMDSGECTNKSIIFKLILEPLFKIFILIFAVIPQLVQRVLLVHQHTVVVVVCLTLLGDLLEVFD